MDKRSILLIYTGGTIGMMKDYSSGALKAFDFSQLLKNIPTAGYNAARTVPM